MINDTDVSLNKSDLSNTCKYKLSPKKSESSRYTMSSLNYIPSRSGSRLETIISDFSSSKSK